MVRDEENVIGMERKGLRVGRGGGQEREEER